MSMVNPHWTQLRAMPNAWPAIAVVGILLLAGPSHAGQYKCEKLPWDPTYNASVERKLSSAERYAIVTAQSSEEAKTLARSKLGATQVGCSENAAPMSPGVAEKPPEQPAVRAPTEPRETPFSTLTMGDYFDAIYNGRLADVRQKDDRYLGKAIAQYKDFLDKTPLAKKLIGDLDTSKASLVVPTIRSYAQNYGRAYEKCLGTNAVSFTMRTTTRDRTGTHTSDTVYRMNPEFSQAFQSTAEVGQRDSLGEGVAALGDASVGNPVQRIEIGTQELMRAFRCDDAVIKRFESHLLEMYLAIAKGKQ